MHTRTQRLPSKAEDAGKQGTVAGRVIKRFREGTGADLEFGRTFATCQPGAADEDRSMRDGGWSGLVHARLCLNATPPHRPSERSRFPVRLRGWVKDVFHKWGPARGVSPHRWVRTRPTQNKPFRGPTRSQ